MKNDLMLGALVGVITLLTFTVLISFNHTVKCVEPLGWLVFSIWGMSFVIIRRLINKVWP